jgi:hypothetical protein
MTCGGVTCDVTHHANPLASTNGVAHQLINGDPIAFGGGTLDFAVQFYAKTTGCTGCDATHFAVYNDASLTTPSDYVTDALAQTTGTNSSMAYVAEACPSVAFSIKFDTNPSGQIRCRTIRIVEPQNRWASTAEHNAYPPVCNTGVATWDAHLSWAQDIAVGDTLMDYAAPWRGGNAINGGNKGYVIKVVKNSSCDVEVTIANFWPWIGANTNIPTVMFNYQLDTHNNNFNFGYAFNSSIPGWSPTEEPSWGMHNFGLINTTDSTLAFQPIFIPYGSGHPDLFGSSSNFRWADFNCNPFQGTVATFLTLNCPGNINNVWNYMNGRVNNQQLGIYSDYQSVRQINAPMAEQVWSTNAANTNACGNPQFDNPCNTTSTTAPSLQGGTTGVYSVVVSPSVATVNAGNIEYIYKTFGFTASTGWWNYNDISSVSTGNVLTDSTQYAFCVVLVNGQCRSGSTKGQIYMQLPAASGLYTVDVSGNCIGNSISVQSPCIYPAGSLSNWAYQWQNNPPDITAQGYRKISNQYMAVGAGMTFPPFPGNSGGEFAVYPQCNVDDSWRCDFFISKLPNWPGNTKGSSGNNVDRTRWHQVRLTGNGSSNEEYQFGYGEYGNPTDFFCTPYNDICSSKVPTATSDPFGFSASDSFSTSSCPCVINAVHGRVLYYRYHDIAGGVFGPTQVMAVP